MNKKFNALDKTELSFYICLAIAHSILLVPE